MPPLQARLAPPPTGSCDVTRTLCRWCHFESLRASCAGCETQGSYIQLATTVQMCHDRMRTLGLRREAGLEQMFGGSATAGVRCRGDHAPLQLPTGVKISWGVELILHTSDVPGTRVSVATSAGTVPSCCRMHRDRRDHESGDSERRSKPCPPRACDNRAHGWHAFCGLQLLGALNPRRRACQFYVRVNTVVLARWQRTVAERRHPCLVHKSHP